MQKRIDIRNAIVICDEIILQKRNVEKIIAEIVNLLDLLQSPFAGRSEDRCYQKLLDLIRDSQVNLQLVEMEIDSIKKCAEGE